MKAIQIAIDIIALIVFIIEWILGVDSVPIWMLITWVCIALISETQNDDIY